MFWDPDGLCTRAGRCGRDHYGSKGPDKESILRIQSEAWGRPVAELRQEWDARHLEAQQMQVAFLKGAATGAGVAVVIVTLPVSGTTLLIVGGTVAVGACSYMGYQRYQAGQSAGDAVLGGLADGTGVSFIHGSFANEDFVTGESLNLSSIEMAERQGNVFGGFIVAPMAGPLRNGFMQSLPQGALRNRYLALALADELEPSRKG